MADPWIALAAIASATKRIQFGAIVTPVARRHPWKLAREAVTLDHLSEGRVVLGVGLGEDMWSELSGFGTPSGTPTDDRVRAETLDEGLTVITGLWSGEPFAFQGKHYTVKETTFLPKTHPVAADSDLGGRAMAAQTSVKARGAIRRGGSNELRFQQGAHAQ